MRVQLEANNEHGMNKLGKGHGGYKMVGLLIDLDDSGSGESNSEVTAEAHEGIDVHIVSTFLDAIESGANACCIRRF